MKKHLMLGILGTCVVAVCFAQNPGTPPDAPMGPPPPAARGPAMDVALDAARAAVKSCAQKGQAVAAAVVDSAGITKVLLAGDSVFAMGVESSARKAATAVMFRMPTSDLGTKMKNDADLAAKVAAGTGYIPWPGGVPLMLGGEIIGAIGVGGARDSLVDEACARAGSAAVQGHLKIAANPLRRIE